MRKPSVPQIVEVEPETNMDGVSVMDARRYTSYCNDRVRIEQEARGKAERPAR